MNSQGHVTSWKVLGKNEKKKNNFFIFDFIMKNVKKSKMYNKITYFLKLFNFYIKN